MERGLLIQDNCKELHISPIFVDVIIRFNVITNIFMKGGREETICSNEKRKLALLISVMV
jgi:hypothetical protein